MKLQILSEPELQFGHGRHVCPRTGIRRFDVYDSIFEARRDRLLIGAVGISDDIESLENWILRCQDEISAKPNVKQPALFPPFCGFNVQLGFRAKMSIGDRMTRTIRKRDVRQALRVEKFNQRIKVAVALFVSHVRFLCQNRTPDVIVCVIPDDLYERVRKKATLSAEDQIEDTEPDDLVEADFRRSLKASCLSLGVPLQLIRAKSLESNPPAMQDDATKAWNFCTALYYKASRTAPWRLPVSPNLPETCYAGVGFYRSRDRKVLHTSLAQIFDDLGKSVILRGTPVDISKEDRRPFLRFDQAEELISRAIHAYKNTLGHAPSRMVLHRTSGVRAEELAGFESATSAAGISILDLVSVRDTDIRLFREGLYPPNRGTMISLSKTEHLLYTRGSIDYYQTYPGSYIPHPLRISTEHAEFSPKMIAEEILALSKMNWNDTQFDGRLPITISCARKVGEILKYLDENQEPQISYSYYM